MAALLSVAWGLARVFLGGFLAMLGIGAVAGAIFAVIGFLFGNQIIAALTASLLSAGAQVIRWTATIFDFFIEHLIIKYSATLETLGIKGGIDLVWTTFRDVANIALIALFVFLAINIILGVKEFGEKKTIAKVLIIATLINFSLLFTKIIIDAANFTAYQFYKSAGLERSAGGAASSGGVANVFLNATGIITWGDTYTGVEALAADKGKGTALAFAVVASFLLLVMVGLFLYGSFQMITRAILLLFLMILSPLAFVSWLMPSSTLEAGWKKWWEALLGAAFFSPLFMMALWASMLLLQRATQARGGATLGEFFTNPLRSAEAWTLIVVYCVAAGLLYASIKFASTFANTISGFGVIGQGLRNAMIGAPALAWRFGVAPLARQSIGRWAYGRQEKWVGESRILEGRAGAAEREAEALHLNKKFAEAEAKRREAASLHREAAHYGTLQARAGRFAERGFNIGDIGVLKQLTKAAGISELASGQRPKDVDIGYKQAIERRIDRAEKEMKPLEVSASQREKIMHDTREDVYDGKVAAATPYLDAHRKALTEHGDAQKNKETLEKNPEFAQLREQARRIKAGLKGERDRELAQLKAEFTSASTDADRQAKLAEISSRTKHWETQLKDHDKATEGLLEPLTAAENKLNDAAENLRKAGTDLNKFADEEGKRRVRDRRVGSVGTAEIVGRQRAGVFYTLTGQRGHIGREVAGKIRGRIGREGRLSKMLERIPDEALPPTVGEEE